jgi:hypothetical protein
MAEHTTFTGFFSYASYDAKTDPSLRMPGSRFGATRTACVSGSAGATRSTMSYAALRC